MKIGIICLSAIIFLFSPGSHGQEIDSFSNLKTVLQQTSPYFGSTTDLIISSDQRLFASIDGELLQVWDITKVKVIKTFNDNDIVVGIPIKMAFSPDSKLLAFSTSTRPSRQRIIIHDIEKDKVLKEFAFNIVRKDIKEKYGKFDGRPWIDILEFSNDGKRLFSAGYGNTIQVWDVTTGELVANLRAGKSPGKQIFALSTAITSVALVDDTAKNQIEVWNYYSNNFTSFKGHTGEVFSISFTADGKRMISASRDKTIRIWNVRSGEQIKLFTDNDIKDNSTGYVKFSPDGSCFISEFYVYPYLRYASSGEKIFDFGLLKYSFFTDGSGFMTLDIDRPRSSSIILSLYNLKEQRIFSKKVIPVGSQSKMEKFFEFSPDGEYLIWSDYDDKVNLLKMVNGGKSIIDMKRKSPYYGGGIPPERLNFMGKFSEKGDLFAYQWDSQMVLLNISVGDQKRYKFEGGKFVCGSCFEFAKDGLYVFYAKEGWETIDVYRIQENKAEIVYSFKGEKPFNISPDGRYLAFKQFNSNNITVVEIATGKILGHFPGNDSITLLKFSADSKYLISAGLRLFKILNVSSFKEIATDINKLSSYGSNIVFHPKKNYLAIVEYGKEVRRIHLMDISTGEIINSMVFPFKGIIYDLHFSLDGGSVTAYSNHDLITWEIPSLKLIKIIEYNYAISKQTISNRYKIIAAELRGGGIQLIDYNSGKPILNSYFFEDAILLHTPEGFFSGTGDFNKYVHFVKGLEVFEFNQFYDAFYRPDLVEKKLKGEDISKESGGLNIEEAIKSPPPQVAILSPKEGDSISERTVTVKVQIIDTGGGIGDIRVHHNGKLVDSLGVYRLAKTEADDRQKKLARADIENPYQTAKRGTSLRRVWEDKEKKDIRIVDFTPTKGNVEKTYNITLINGENTLSVSAFNGTNTVMSSMENIKIKANISEKKPEVFVLSIGNNNFANTSYNLNMAIKDSKDFSEIIKKVASPLYEKINIETLADPGKTVITEAIASIAGRMKPEDIFILFAATHGRAEDDLYYLYTSNFDGDIRNPKNYISSVELMELSKKIPALKQVFILDTCQSGGVETIVSGLYDARISVLAKSLGMHIFAGAKSFQAAQDVYKGNGLFTYFVLRGLEGQADENLNKEVTLLEMNPYLSRSVKDASKGSQEPFVRNFGDDLPISKVMK